MYSVQSLLQILTLTCDGSSRLVSDGFERELNKAENAALRVHLFSCRGCKRMRRQFEWLHSVHRETTSSDQQAGVSLSPKARQRIEQKLQD